MTSDAPGKSLRAVLGFCHVRQMSAPEADSNFRPGLFTDDGEVTDESVAAFLTDLMLEFRDYIEPVTVLPPTLTPPAVRVTVWTWSLRRWEASGR